MTRRRTAAVAALVVGVVCAWTCGARESPDDNGFHQDVANSTNAPEVRFDSTVLNDPTLSRGHQPFQSRAPHGETLESKHSTTLAPSPPLHTAGTPLLLDDST